MLHKKPMYISNVPQAGSVLQLGPFSLSPTEFHLKHGDSTTLQVSHTHTHTHSIQLHSAQEGGTFIYMYINVHVHYDDVVTPYIMLIDTRDIDLCVCVADHIFTREGGAVWGALHNGV